VRTCLYVAGHRHVTRGMLAVGGTGTECMPQRDNDYCRISTSCNKGVGRSYLPVGPTLFACTPATYTVITAYLIVSAKQ
jgi:hypothetical protein